jgi:uncharacterized coiled-coil DUF342 family protein
MSDEPEMTALRAELEETRKTRDQWCAEYTKLRDEMQEGLARMQDLLERIAVSLGIPP